MAIEGLLDDPAIGRRFKRVLDDARSVEVRRIFAAQLSRYAWRRLRRRNPIRAVRALALARRVAGVQSWNPGPVPEAPRADRQTEASASTESA